MYKIEKNVPMAGSKIESPYPFSQMVIGDSFFVENGNRITLGQAASYQKRKHGTAYSVRAVDGGFRVWRVA
jgi:hypothetical protein